jgi:arylsulfatase A-like enzyme
LNIKEAIMFLLVVTFIVVAGLIGISITGNVISNLGDDNHAETIKYASSVISEDYVCENCNVLLVTIDTLRADHLSTFGYYRETSPNIDALADKGIKFSRAYSQIPFTPPSHWSIMTSQYPHNHQIGLWADGNANVNPNAAQNTHPANVQPRMNISQQVKNQKALNRSLPDIPTLNLLGTGKISLKEIRLSQMGNFPVLPIILKENGYANAAFVSSDMVKDLDFVFDNFSVYNDGFRGAGKPGSPEEGRYATSNEAIKWLEQSRGDKFFLWMHLWDPHGPYEPPAEFDIFSDGNTSSPGNAEAKYDGEIRFADHKVEMVLDKIKELNLDKNTIVIIMADHGEAFGESGCTDYTGRDKCMGHYTSLTDPEIHIPLIIKLPGIDTPMKVDNVVQSVDVLPTILDLLGIPLDKKADGSSLVPLMTGKGREYNFAFSELKKGAITARSLLVDKWKFVGIEKNHDALARLYDTKRGEAADMYSGNREIAEELEQETDNLVEGKELVEEIPDEETEQMLKSLGYIN